MCDSLFYSKHRYNSDGFDLPYILERATALKRSHLFAKSFKDSNFPWRMVKTTKGSKQMGEREVALHDLAGTATLDVLDVIRDNYKLRSYKLNDVAEHFLKVRDSERR